MKQFYKTFLTLLWAIGLLTFSGCASIVSKTSYRLPINSNPNNARITVLDMKGRTIHTATTPTIVRLKSGSGFFKKAGYLVKFELEGYDTKTVPVHFDINGWYFGNVVFGGLVGLLIIDPLTGAMWKLDTHYISETLQINTAAANPTLELRDYNTLPSEMKEHLIPIN